ncbi:hypothetical protein O6H91_12G021700 [Diphasiastrum complanatum]|uniref:Uncharacterized protein n=11 Tax=Diphasiastrum complanatum TaxID=34168 RepID=A0ACC2BZK4_DIPCM|nr:hypothetical protein O6H91_12G021700 [Diphasiastrum complanatum]KAJ7535167.1 hypothetical protein O6H91_12G021700 [Diphasiastrum complanatum]KAJ7535168.1 hypothetical protein O6H91_12G021700 [Diphasiastrum complanatum]KAJ7535169.1 hypothetical protein O6H91_12G021700 [Diphasiastrum complanatum]KAJ7535170.1 hypothetical protein O6H91_12G021700 [Diphasiastrum complanatum]
MGAPKQKWTPEEEAALRAGVEKYGPGKWRAIQKDSKLGPCLVSRSNVDLKDKWRNMNGSPNGHGHSRARKVKKLMEAIPVKPLAIMPAEEEADTAPVISEVEAASANRTERRSLGARYDELVVQAILTLKEPNGSSISEIAGYIEERRRVPSKFRRLLTSKVKSLALQGKLIKVGKNFKVKDGDFLFDSKPTKGLRLRRKDNEGNFTPTFLRDMPKRLRGDVGLKKPYMDFELAKSTTRTAEEAARVAAQAVADAEAAAAAAEQAAMEAEAAEAEAEAAQAAAEAAALAVRPPKKSSRPISSNRAIIPVAV